MNCDCYVNFYRHSNFKRVIAVPKPTLPVFKTVSGSGLRGKEFIELPNEHRFKLLAEQKYCFDIGIAWLSNLVDECNSPENFCDLITSIHKVQEKEGESVNFKHTLPKTFSSLSGRIVNFKEDLLTHPNGIFEFLDINKSRIFIFYWFFKDKTKNYAHAIAIKYNRQTRKYTLLNPSLNYEVITELDNKGKVNDYILDFLEKETKPDHESLTIKTMTVERQKFKDLEPSKRKSAIKGQNQNFQRLTSSKKAKGASSLFLHKKTDDRALA